MTHPLLARPISLNETPVFASMMNDPQFGELAKQFLDPPTPAADMHREYPRRSFLADFNHPLSCPACSPSLLLFQMHDSGPEPINRGLALPAGETTAQQLARSVRPRKTRSK